MLESAAFMCLKSQIVAYKAGIKETAPKVKSEAEALKKVIEEDGANAFKAYRAMLFDRKHDKDKVNMYDFCSADTNIKRCTLKKPNFDEVHVVLNKPEGEAEFMEVFKKATGTNEYHRFRKIHFKLGDKETTTTLENVLPDADFALFAKP